MIIQCQTTEGGAGWNL